MNKYKGTHYWDNNFENHFWIPATKSALQDEIHRSEELTYVVRTVIVDEKGEVLYDVKKEGASAASQKEDGSSNRTQKKKAVRKKTRTKTG
jgi:uncharacterized protein GlcG (DUF336 family)